MPANLPTSGLAEIALWILRFRRRYRVTGTSMLPALQAGDEVLANPRAYRHQPPAPGDLVVARHPFRANVWIIKRVHAVHPSGKVELRGDNPPESTDSRALGSVPLGLIVARVTCRLR